MKKEKTMLKNMKIGIEYKIYVEKDVIAENNEANGDQGYETLTNEFNKEIEKIIQPTLNKLSKKCNYIEHEKECETYFP